MRPGLRRAALAATAVVGALLAPGVAEAAPWCGTAANADRPAAATGYPVRVLYLFPSDGADRSAERAPAIWADVEELDSWWRSNDPARTLNFDLAPFSCGRQLDLVSRRASVAGDVFRPLGSRIAQVRDELYVRARLDATFAKYLVYYDGPVENPAVCGESGTTGASGTGFAVVYVQACPDVSRPQVAARHLVHALGALFRVTAPNACPGATSFVCDATSDILHRDAQQLPLSSFVLDVGRNDYYAHTSPWFDLQDSRWLRHLDASTNFSVAIRGRGSVRSDVPGLLCLASCVTAWNPGIDLRLVAESAPGQRFVRWSGGCQGRIPRCDVLLDSPLTVSALFAPARYQLAVRVTGRGRITGAGAACAVARCTRALTSHRQVTLRAMPAKGWRLKGWTGACRGARATCSVPMTHVTSVRATFVRARA